MKTLRILFTLALLFAPLALLQAQQSQPSMDDPAMKAMMEAAKPGPQHKALQALVGTWDTSIKSYMQPGAPPVESKGTSTFTSILDGRYLQEHAQGNFMGSEFHGYGTFGYDNVTKKYVGSWYDNMSTGIMHSTGSSPDNGKTLRWDGMASDPMSGKEQNYSSVMKQISKDQYQFEMNGPGPDGKQMKMMEITYTRKK